MQVGMKYALRELLSNKVRFNEEVGLTSTVDSDSMFVATLPILSGYCDLVALLNKTHFPFVHKMSNWKADNQSQPTMGDWMSDKVNL